MRHCRYFHGNDVDGDPKRRKTTRDNMVVGEIRLSNTYYAVGTIKSIEL